MRDYKKDSARTFDRLAADYDQSGYGQCHSGWDLYLLSKVQARNSRKVLDIGCGTGVFLARLGESEKIALAGIDISAGMIGEAQRRLGPRADLRIGDSEALPWPDATFDVAVCIASFHHYPNPGAALSEMRRVLKPGGCAFITDILFPPLVRPLVNALLPFLRDGDVHMYSETEMHRLSREAGFTDFAWERTPDGAFLCQVG